MQMILYIVVLVSGISILLRKDGKTDGPERQMTVTGMKAVLFFLLGVATGAVCAASGAGGPVLVMPLLTLIGFPAHTAVGISLFNSVFIAQMFLLLIPVLIAHGIGVAFGSRNAEKIDPAMLKRIVAAASIAIALIKLIL